MHLLELKNIHKQFASQKAVDDLSLSVKAGSIFGLLGPNGAGKTTLIRIITGIFNADQGEILFDGKKFEPLKDFAFIGYMPEERGLYKKMKVGEQAMYLGQLKGLSYAQALEKVKYWFNKLEMQTWWNKKVEDLSKGMSQKLQFVITVLHDPKLIILDEPFSGLDPVNTNLIKDEIFTLAKKGSTIIFSTHRMEQVEEICDQIVLMNKGKKILDGSVQEIRQQFKENVFSIEVKGNNLDTVSESFSISGEKNGKLHVRINEGYTPNDVLKHFINQQASVQAFNEILPSLNEIFIKLVEATPTARQFQTV